MANSPGPTTSKTADPSESTAAKKKKRTRRKPRNRLNNGTADAAPRQYSEAPKRAAFTARFVIEPVKHHSGVFYKAHDKTARQINLKSLLGNVALPRVFSTLSKDLTGKIKNLTLNGGPSPSSVISGKTRKRKQVLFANFLSKKEVDEGLKSGEFVKGSIRINSKHYKESYVSNEDATKADYVIGSVQDRNRALEGDEVVLRVKKGTEDEKKLMEVVFITEKVHPRTAVGFLSPMENNREYALFRPRDKRVPKMKIPRISWPNTFHKSPDLYKNTLFIAKIIEWREVWSAVGMIVENLGLSGDLRVESLAILKKFCLDLTPFGDDVGEFLPRSGEIPADELEYREDLRGECVFTIDPLTAKDLDDAVSCKRLPNGNFEVGAHISDVSYFLEENTKLDKIVRNKATTVYMVDHAYHMLPEELCSRCSLLPGEDKMAFSVIWELTPDGETVGYRIARTIINSCAQLAYEHAQMMIQDPGRSCENFEIADVCNGFTREDVCRVVNDLQKIAVRLREKRQENGYLKIHQPKIHFELDPSNGEPSKFSIVEEKDANRLIEEFMLLANITVAKFILEAHPDLAFLRHHEPPKAYMLMELQKTLGTLGYHIDVSSSKSIQTSLNNYSSDDFRGQTRMMVLSYLLAKPMRRARYFCAGAMTEDVDYTHYALNIPRYTHFTSPIRRYADIMVHRLLAAGLRYRDRPRWSPEYVAAVADRCNWQKYHAKCAGDESSELYLAHYIEKSQPRVEDAVVADAKERYVDVIVLATGSVIRIYSNNFGEGVTLRSEEIQSAAQESRPKKMWRLLVTFPKTATEEKRLMTLEMFTLVKVELTRKPRTNKLEAVIMRPT